MTKDLVLAFSPIYVGVMGPGNATVKQAEDAYHLGKEIRARKWILVSGGTNKGVMKEVNRGACYMAREIAKKLGISDPAEINPMAISILPESGRSQNSPYDRLSIPTGVGQGRNAINIHSSDYVIAFEGGSPGTSSEISLAIKLNKPVILLNPSELTENYFTKMDSKLVHVAKDVGAVLAIVERLITTSKL